MQNSATHAKYLHVGWYIAVTSEIATVVQERVNIAHERVAQNEVY